MTGAQRRERKHRKPSRIATERRRDLIEAAVRSIAEVGYDAVTVASICEAAGFSRGLIGHYFKSKDELLLEAVQFITSELGDATRNAASAAGPDPVARLHAVVKASFEPPGFTPEKVSVWVALTGTARWSPRLAEIYKGLWQDYRRGIGRLIGRAVEERGLAIDVEQAALIFSQLIEGFWVGCAARSVTGDKAEAACHGYLDLLFDDRRGPGKRRLQTDAERATSRGGHVKRKQPQMTKST